MKRTANLKRSTKETDITLVLSLDGGAVDVSTGVGFFDHMLTAFASHGGFGLTVKAQGDLIVDCHHTVEDTAIVLGKAFSQALADKSGIKRFGNAFIPMDESLSFCAVDISGRPYLVFNGAFPQERVGDFDTCMTEEFFKAFSDNSGMTLHIKCEYGKNSHHMIESMFKAFAYAVKTAVEKNEDGKVVSTKGILEGGYGLDDYSDEEI